jgi:hypothetical protein
MELINLEKIIFLFFYFFFLQFYLLEGCGGFVYKFNFDKELNEDDFVYHDKNNEKILFAVDEVTMKFVKGSVIDFEIDMMRQTFFVIKKKKKKMINLIIKLELKINEIFRKINKLNIINLISLFLFKLFNLILI